MYINVWCIYQAIQAVTFLIFYHPLGGHLSFERGHSSIPKGSQRIARYMKHHLN